jgi:glycosyltransferase involved in cell wall biosynthesis
MTDVESPGVSVVLVVKNGAATIAKALASVASQEPAPSEILVVDGGSRDDTREIAARFPLVRVIAQEVPGLGNAYNEGIRAAREDLIAFISCDDEWLPGKVAAQTACLSESPALRCVFTHCVHELLDNAVPAPGFRIDLLGRAVPGWIMESLMARRAVFDEVGWFDARLQPAEDTEWFSRALDAGTPMRMLPDICVRKGVHAGNTSVSLNTRANLVEVIRRSLSRKHQAVAR